MLSAVLTTMIEDEYYILVEILDETHWEKHLFTSTVVAPNDVLGCSSACKTATSPTCDFFVLKVSIFPFLSSVILTLNIGQHMPPWKWRSYYWRCQSSAWSK